MSIIINYIVIEQKQRIKNKKYFEGLAFISKKYKIIGINSTETAPKSNKTSIVNGIDKIEVIKILSSEKILLFEK